MLILAMYLIDISDIVFNSLAKCEQVNYRTNKIIDCHTLVILLI